ncbi:hypothetical protein GCM10028895_10060 [Pontibacter rugosus]
MIKFFESALEIANNIKKDVESSILPPCEITNLHGSQILPLSLFKNTRGYLEKVAIQINQTYEQTCYDACAVMVRRLVEILIIETFEAHQKSAIIKDSNGDYFMLNDLISRFQSESWPQNPSRNLKKTLLELKGIGDKSAHSRFYNAQRSDIDDVKVQLRGATEELLYLSKIKK